MDTFTKSNKKQPLLHNTNNPNNNHNQTLTRLRTQRLRKSTALLGQPDIITVTKIKITSSFFSKQKRTQQTSQYFINGIIFPTTAHFSTYISSKYQSTTQSKSSSSLAIKAKLIMFDAFQQKDIHAQINIPGSLQVKVFNLSGQALKSQPEDYQRAYYSSYLRSLQPMNYPNIVLSPYIYKVQVHKQVLRRLIPFCFQNSLRQLNYLIRPLFTGLLQQEYNGNFALQLVLNFITKNNFWSLVQVFWTQIQKISAVIELRDLEYLRCRLMLIKGEYEQILSMSSGILLEQPLLNQWKQLQIQSLYKVKSFKLVKMLGDNIIRQGGTNYKIYELICMSYLQTKDYKSFLKILNSILTLYNEQQMFIEDIAHHTKRLYFMDVVFTKGENISAYPQLCFQFNNQFLKRQSRVLNYQNSIVNAGINNMGGNNTGISKDVYVQMVDLIKRVDNTLTYSIDNHVNNNNNSNNDNSIFNHFKIFYSLLVKLQKLKGWSEVIKHRGDCFWLETDFKPNNNNNSTTQSSTLLITHGSQLYQSTNKKNTEKSFSSLIDSSTKPTSFKSISDTFITRNMEDNQHPQQRPQIMHHQQIEYEDSTNDPEFEQAGLSDQDQQQEIQDMPACSKRVSNNANTARRKFFNLKKTSSQDNIKVLCSVMLEKLFTSLYDDLRLQIELEKWAAKLNFSKINQLSPEKRQLIAIVFLKKAFLHLKLQRYRKCEQSLKCARKISQTPLILLISSYQLIHLYMKNNTMKGVQFYIVDLIKVLGLYGIRKFDIVPEWAKQIITYIIEMQGMGILGKLAGPFKQLLVRWLRNNHSQNSLLKKDSTNKAQAIYKLSQ